MCFSAGINTKQFTDIYEEKQLAPIRTLNLFIKSLVNPFTDIPLTFFDSSFNSFYFYEINKNLLAKFACFGLALKFSDVNLLNS